MFNALMKLFKFVFLAILFVFKLLFALLNYIVIGIFGLIGLFFNKLRFSIAFKINLLYGFLFVVLFSLAYTVSFGILISQLDSSTPDVSTLTTYFSGTLAIALFSSLIIFSILGSIVVRKMMNPLTVMTKTVETIKENELNERLNTSGAKDELKDLAITFNQLMDRLQFFVERQKQFVSDASHELRTPIAVIEGYAAMLDRWGKEDPKILAESIESIKNETKNMKVLVEKLLFLARSDHNTQKVVREALNLSDLVNQVVKETTFIDDEHEFVCKTDAHVMILGDTHLIKELIRILVDNAIKYTAEGGTITLYSVATLKNVVLSVKDTGIGISNDHIPHLFERFYRTSEARDKNSGGTGLGLAIAKWIIDTHDATVDVSSTVGEGTEFIIFFPLSTSAV